MENSSRFFSNVQCTYFPCHKGLETFNCLFCYCPLYLLPECGGEGVFLANGIKDCTPCLFPHRPENYDAIVKRLGAHIRKRAAESIATAQTVSLDGTAVPRI